ncbi:hypothetical protein GCM10020000_84650 [Streptomyces olivoverticillatus]
MAALIRLTVQAPSDYLPNATTGTVPPEEWTRTPAARDLRLLPHPVSANGTVQPFNTGSHTLHLDPRLGLVRQDARSTRTQPNRPA